MKELKIILLISAVVLFIIVFYQWLLRYLHKDEINVKFSYLFPFEKEIFRGAERFKIDLPETSHVRAEILETSDGELLHLVFEGRLKQGIAEMDIDFGPVQNGEYQLKIVLADQTITRFIRVENEIN